ncbi:MAG: response regulator [Sphingobium sp.]
MTHDGSMEGQRLLVVEDDYFIASDLAGWLEGFGVDVVGPAASVSEALLLLDAGGGALDGAILDVNLGVERVFPVADALQDRGVPFLFLTGYESAAIPEAYRAAPKLDKPVHKTQLLRTIETIQRDD